MELALKEAEVSQLEAKLQTTENEAATALAGKPTPHTHTAPPSVTSLPVTSRHFTSLL